jgi:hypothetical protein
VVSVPSSGGNSANEPAALAFATHERPARSKPTTAEAAKIPFNRARLEMSFKSHLSW